MKILQEGTLTKTAPCPRCKSVLEYEPEDVKHTTYMDSDTISDIKYHIKCPFCQTRLGENYSFVYVEQPSKQATPVNVPKSSIDTEFREQFRTQVRAQGKSAAAVMALPYFLSAPQITRAAQLYGIYGMDSATKIQEQVIAPNLAAINAALGQENDPRYLAYAVAYVLSQTSEKS